MPLIPDSEIRELKSSIDLRVLAAGYTELQGTREQFGSCPRCGGKDRFHVQADKFFCRICYPPEVHRGNHDVFDFLIFIGEAENFRSAVEFLLQLKGKTPLPPVRQKVAEDRKLQYLSKEWQDIACRFSERAQELLFSEYGAKGREYLENRGLSLETCEEHDLGLTSAKDADNHFSWAITIPWFEGDYVSAVQFRFINPVGKQRYSRFSAKRYYGETIIYQTVVRGSSTLVVTEGEFNALSVWQETEFDVVSVGSQNSSLKTINRLVELSKGYERIFLWFDDIEASRAVLKCLGRGEIVEQAEDANALLQKGILKTALSLFFRS